MTEFKKIELYDLRKMKDQEGLILQGCGGDLNEWSDGINSMLRKEGILQGENQFNKIYVFQNGELTNLLFPFEGDLKVDIGKLAMWRLMTHEAFGGTWLSDYVENELDGFISDDLAEQEGIVL